MSKEIAEEYASSLADLTVNSKPLINMLTILAEENIDHAGVIVETVEKHLEKVHPDIKLPVLYLVDSIIKNVGRAYTQKFSQIIVNMFTRTFKQVDEKVRSQMFKLRETWHDVFPATKLYQLDVKVNLIDPAWPIQAQPQQSNIHPVATTSTATAPPTEDEEKMRTIVAKKEQELLMLQRKKIEMELEQARRQLEITEKSTKMPPAAPPSATVAPSIPRALVNPVVAPVAPVPAEPVPVKQRLGPPVPKQSRIAPVSGALAGARRDPRLARRGLDHVMPTPSIPPPIAPNVFDIKPLDRIHKRKNVITIDVQPDVQNDRPRDPRRRDPRLDRRDKIRAKREERKREERRVESEKKDEPKPEPIPDFINKIPDMKKISKLPPIPKISKADDANKESPKKRKDEKKDKDVRVEKKPRRDGSNSSKDSNSSSPEKRPKSKEKRKKERREEKQEEEKAAESEVVAFKELRNYHKERYMRRNKEKSESPEKIVAESEDVPVSESSNAPEVAENKDIDLRILPTVEVKASPVTQKRPSTELLEGKSKKNKHDKFDILFGNEDVDLRQLPQVEEVSAPPPPHINDSPKTEGDMDVDLELEYSPKKVRHAKPVFTKIDGDVDLRQLPQVEEAAPAKSESPKPADDNMAVDTESAMRSPKKDWNEVKEKSEEVKKTPSKLDLVRAKLAEATKVKDGLGRPLLFSKSPSVEKERRRTLSSEDTDLRSENTDDFDAKDHKKAISIIMSQAKEQYSDGNIDKNQYNALMYQVLQLNEKLKLKEAKQRESFEQSKRKLQASIDKNHKVASPKTSPKDMNKFGDIDERITPALFLDTPPDSQQEYLKDSDMRMSHQDLMDGPSRKGLLPYPPRMPAFGPFPGPERPMWRGNRLRMEEFGPRRFRGPNPQFYRGNRALRPQFEPPRPMMPPLPTPQMGTCQGECPLAPYEPSVPPPPLGASGIIIPPTDFRILEYIDQDPMKTIQIDGIPREIRFYGDTAVIMMDWDDPRELKFLPGSRRVTFDNKDSVVLSFNEGYKQVEIDDQVFEMRFGAPTRELYINGRWFECFFGGQPLGVIIDGKPRLVHLEGPLPQVDIGKTKRQDLVAGKINLIVNATQMFPIYLDAKVQKFQINNQYFTIRFVDSLRTVLINEQPFKVEFGDLPKPISLGNEKYFIRFSALPRFIKPGQVHIANMEGAPLTVPPEMPILGFEQIHDQNSMDVDQETPRPQKTPSPETNLENQGLDMLASVMPSSIAPASASEYSSAEPFFTKPDKIPGLEIPADEKPNPMNPILLANMNVNDLFAKLVATGLVNLKNETKEEPKAEPSPEKPKEDKSVVHKVDLLKPETLKVKQQALVWRLYGGMQCSGCGARFPPERTVRYSQHLDWHFRQNRRDRDSARRAHSRHWHYDLSDWVQYEELEDLEEREKSWFETGGGSAAEREAPAPLAPSAPAGAPHHHCALCGDHFDQFYNEDKEEWHLRNSVTHNGDHYHPMCFEDYKASLTKVESEAEVVEEVAIDKIDPEEAIEIKDTDEINSQSDNESEVEVVEPEPEPIPEPVEIDEGEEDDVVFKAEPVEQVEVEDDADTDDETALARAERDREAALLLAHVRVKLEPRDPDDEPIITAEEEVATTVADTTHARVTSTIDGNVQLDAASPAAAAAPLGGIRINISKLPAFVNNNTNDQMLEDISADDEPLPPGEEPELEYKLKPNLEGIHFSRQPPVQRGSELSGLCSIM
ncbi:pre-mRNA cleavage complex 2 protein Pcf11 isoform X2 [Plodia interpunctella]|uniref:pre-mRNA cleavage complex 2 protein Pcf11 isoform X2 n=1 Tax=Plodia interpunctella TaxID=58824 RepID=UPI0023676CB4|nr:pre-mRNA cleavage complex 2 protein Pcf11 isoform X2 [Plodia interpunctella]